MSKWKRNRDWGMITGNGNKGKHWDIGKGNRDLGQGVETGVGMEVWNREDRDKGWKCCASERGIGCGQAIG